MNEIVDDRPSSGAVAVHAGRHADDPIIYFTLIDFLVQLLFFGLFIFVVFQFGGGNEDEEQRWAKKFEWAMFDAIKSNLPFYSGMSELVFADSQEAMLKALQELEKQGLLEEFLKFATQTNSPLEVIQYCAREPARCKQLVAQCERQPEACGRFAEADTKSVQRLMNALGAAPCLPGGQPLFSIEGHGSGLQGEEGHFVIREVFPAGRVELSRAGIKLVEGQQLSKAQARTMFRPLYQEGQECRHYVDYFTIDDSEAMRHIFEQTFYVRRKSVKR